LFVNLRSLFFIPLYAAWSIDLRGKKSEKDTALKLAHRAVFLAMC